MGNLPTQPTTFVGRMDELAEISQLLNDPACRLLTLVGQGGIGKTRLALQAAANQTSVYPHGVYIVPLQSITSPDLMPSAIASALKIMFYGAEEPHIQIINYLREKHLLLVMDNFEHLLDGITLLTDVLAAAPDVKILTTSRERLNVQEEWTLTLAGLPFPDERTTDALEKYEAVQLFVGRARQVQSTFSLKDNAEAVRAICQQVEGMPLGIELAASWLRVMNCQQIAAQMARSLEFLTTPLRNIPERHRSIRAVFEQSWNLLSENEQKVLMKLLVFRGGFDLEAAETVAGASLMMLAGLVDKSLVRVQASGRYDLHELLRQYTADKLIEGGESEAVARQHLDYFMKLAEEMEGDLFSSRQTAWLARMNLENDNLRAALAWSLSAEEGEGGLRLAGALGWFWHILCYWREGRDWLEKLLLMGEEVSPAIYGYALYHAGDLAALDGDGDHATLRLEQALDLARKTGDKRNIAWALSAQGYLFGKQATEGLKEALLLFREMKDNWGTFHSLIRLAMASENLDSHMAHYSEALALAREAGAGVNIAWSLTLLAVGHHLHSDPKQADVLLEEAISRFREVHDRHGIADTLVWAAIVAEDQGDYERSEAAFMEAIDVRLELGYSLAKSFCVGLSAPLLVWKLGSLKWATRILAANKTTSDNNFWAFRIIYDNHLAALRLQLGKESFDRAWSEGKAMSIQQAVAYALGEEPLPIETMVAGYDQRSSQSLIEPLSVREFEVLRLMADGLSNPQIAEQLVVATGTVKAHTNNIFGKLNVSNRVQAVNRAKDLNLL